VNRERGKWLMREDGLRVLVTLHPSALLRMDAREFETAFSAWLDDLRQAARFIRQRAPQDRFDRVRAEGLQDEDLRAGQQRGVHLERRVLRRGPNQDDVAGFHAGEEGVLLRLVETMDLVDEDDRSTAHPPPAILRRRHHLFDFLDSSQDRAEGHKVRLGNLRDHPGERCLAGTGWSPEDDRLQEIAFNRFAQRSAGREDRVLADDLVERSRTHPLGKGSPWRGSGACLAGAPRGRRRIEQAVTHGLIRCRRAA